MNKCCLLFANFTKYFNNNVTIPKIQKRRDQKPDRPKPRRRKDKGKGKNSNGRLKTNEGSPKAKRNQASSSAGHGSTMPVMSYTSDPTTSSHTSDGSSQEMVPEDEVETQTMVKRPSLNRSFSENYDKYSKKADVIESASIQSDNEEHKNVSNSLIDNLKTKENSGSLDSIQSSTGSTGSIDSQKSCDSGFVDIKSFNLQVHDSVDEASDAIDTEEDIASRKVSTHKSIITTLLNEGEIVVSKRNNVLERSNSSLVTDSVNTYISENGCETNTSLRRTSTVASANVDGLCNLCNERPKDACFVHQKISHQYCCYKCAKKLYRISGTCPVCRRKVEKITRNILA